jgi:hypothetical protein
MKLHLAGGGRIEISGISQIVVKQKKIWHRVEGPRGIEWIMEAEGRPLGSVAMSHRDMLDYILASTKKKALHVWVCGETINIEKRGKKARPGARKGEMPLRRPFMACCSPGGRCYSPEEIARLVYNSPDGSGFG